MFMGVAMEQPLFPSAREEFGLVAWVGQSPLSVCRGGAGKSVLGVVGGQRDYCLPDLQTFFYIYI